MQNDNIQKSWQTKLFARRSDIICICKPLAFMVQKEYISKNHSKFLIKYHVILICKYSKKLLSGEYRFGYETHTLKYRPTIQVYRSKLQRIFWRENIFWTDGYFVASIGNVSQETLKHYIENQG